MRNALEATSKLNAVVAQTLVKRWKRNLLLTTLLNRPHRRDRIGVVACVPCATGLPDPYSPCPHNRGRYVVTRSICRCHLFSDRGKPCPYEIGIACEIGVFDVMGIACEIVILVALLS